MAAVGLLFAPLAPLIALAAAIVFLTSSWVYKYQLMYIYITQVETGGVRFSFFCCQLQSN
jgi:calcium permeable stress-gated cation channel